MYSEIVKGDKPAWYILTFDEGKLGIRIWRDGFMKFLDDIPTVRMRAPEIGPLKLHEPVWSMDAAQIGYGACLPMTIEGDWVHLAFSIQRPKDDSDAWLHHLYCLTATFQMLFWYFRGPVETMTEEQQLITVDAILASNGAFPLSVALSPDFLQWQASQGEVFNIEPVSLAMADAIAMIMGIDYNIYVNNCRCSVSPTSIHLVPGMRCGLDTSYSDIYDLQSHNVDTPYVTFTLLAGLARLCEVVRGSL